MYLYKGINIPVTDKIVKCAGEDDKYIVFIEDEPGEEIQECHFFLGVQTFTATKKSIKIAKTTPTEQCILDKNVA